MTARTRNLPAVQVADFFAEDKEPVLLTVDTRKKKVWVLKVDVEGTPLLRRWKDEWYLIPSSMVGATFALDRLWIFEVKVQNQAVFYRCTDQVTRKQGEWSSTASGALDLAHEATCGKAMDPSVNGRGMLGVFTKPMRAFLVACCRDKLPADSPLLAFATEVIKVHNSSPDEMVLLTRDPLVNPSAAAAALAAHAALPASVDAPVPAAVAAVAASVTAKKTAAKKKYATTKAAAAANKAAPGGAAAAQAVADAEKAAVDAKKAAADAKKAATDAMKMGVAGGETKAASVTAMKAGVAGGETKTASVTAMTAGDDEAVADTLLSFTKFTNPFSTVPAPPPAVSPAPPAVSFGMCMPLVVWPQPSPAVPVVPSPSNPLGQEMVALLCAKDSVEGSSTEDLIRSHASEIASLLRRYHPDVDMRVAAKRQRNV